MNLDTTQSFIENRLYLFREDKRMGKSILKKGYFKSWS